jgi:ABC-type lipoprotein release transport system permease subunit
MITFAAFLILGCAVAFYGALLAMLIAMAIYLWLDLLDQFKIRRSRKRLEQEALPND